MTRLLVLLFVTATVLSGASVAGLRCEYKVNPVGIDALAPRLSWQLRSSERGVMQTAYRIQVASTTEALAAGRDLLWDTGRIVSGQSIHVPYAGPALASMQRYFWRVRTWQGNGKASDWSEPAYWETGLLNSSDWTAMWITPSWEEDKTSSQPSPVLRKEFDVRGAVQSARAYVTSLGLYEMELNGKRVGDELFTPGWTSYKKRLQYQTYDVTEQLKTGENAIRVTLGDGWYRGYLGWRDRRNVYGDTLALLLQLRITYEDGREQVVTSDESWEAAKGPIRKSDIYMGEEYDARVTNADWSGVRALDHAKDILIAAAGPPIRAIEEVKPVKMLKTPSGETVVDFGQNMVGWVRLKVSGSAGDKVTLRHGEVLDKEGSFYTENLRSAKQLLEYTLKGDGQEVYEPRFTFMGFRYVAVDEFPGDPALDNFTGIVIHSDMPVTGEFEASKPLLNELQHNILWGQKGNFLDVPTDCPQRDERLGWTGDAQVFSRTAAFNMDVAAFFTKWLGDLAADQTDDGRIPHVVPDVLGGMASAGWADAGAIIPWNMYLAYGDKRILEAQYDSMKAWVGYMKAQSGSERLWNTGTHFGDWLAFATTRSDYPGATTGKDFIATAFFAYSTSLLAKTAAVLGHDGDARYYETLANEVKAAWQREFVTAAGRVGENTQTAYTLALQFDLLPPHLRLEAARRLVADIGRHGDHITTGFVGASYLPFALSGHGQLDTAYKLLNQETYPSWLYPVKNGATTIWERWDGRKPDGTFQDPGMNSFNHYAYGAIGDWMYRVVAVAQLHHRRHPAAPLLVGGADDGGVEHGRVGLDRALDLLGEDLLAARVDGHRAPAEQRDRAVLLQPGEVAGDGVAGAVRCRHEGLGRLLLVLVVAEGDVAAAGQLADLARPGLHDVEVLVEHDGVSARRDPGAALHLRVVLRHHQHPVVAALRRPDRVGQHEVGEAGEPAVLDRRGEHRGAGRERHQRAGVVVVGVGLELFDEGPSHRIAGHHQRVDPLGVHQPPGLGGVEPGRQHDRVPREGLAHQSPLAGPVHERGDEVEDQRVGVGLGDHVLGTPDALLGHGVDATAEGHEHLLVLPHHALGHAGGATGVQDVEVVAGARTEVALGALGGEGVLVGDRIEAVEVLARVVLDHDRVLELGQGIEAVPDARGPRPLVDERLEIGVVEDVAQLVLDVAVVDVDPHRPDLEDGPHRLDPLDPVVGVDADVVTRPDTVGRQVVGQLVGPGLHLGVGPALAVGDQALPVTEVVDRVLEQIGEVELHPPFLPVQVDARARHERQHPRSPIRGRSGWGCPRCRCGG